MRFPAGLPDKRAAVAMLHCSDTGLVQKFTEMAKNGGRAA
jgi:hypothetical protein